VFPYFGAKNRLIATQRAIIDNLSLKSTPSGKCILTLSQAQVNPSFAILHENALFYTLKKSCISLNLQGYDMSASPESITMYFSNKTSSDCDNFARFIASNPLFVEFCVNGKLSIAYTIDLSSDFIFSTSQIIKNKNSYGKCTNNECIAVKFTRTGDPTKSCDQNEAFKYSDYSPNQTLLTDADLSTIQQNVYLRDGLINMWIYYLDELDSNFQATGRTLPIDSPQIDNTNNVLTIFDTGFKRWSSSPYKVDLYEFMNNIALMYYNFIIPVFTVSFDISITIDMFNNTNISGNSPYNLLICTMNNGFGGSSGCQNNIFAVQLQIDQNNPNQFNLYFLTGNNTDCGFNSPNSQNLIVSLPWLTPNNVISIIATFGPNQKHVLAMWKDINSGDLGIQMLYAKHIDNYIDPASDPCGYKPIDMTNTNNATQLFASKTLNPRPSLQNITLSCPVNPEQFVIAVNEFTLGYVNMNNYL